MTPVTDTERHDIIEAIKSGKARNAIARDTGRSQGTITRIAKANGLTFDRAATRRATEARQIDNRARRAELVTGMLDDALRLRRRLFAPITVNAVAKSGVVVNYTDAEPSPSDQRNLAVAIKVLADSATALERIDVPEFGGSAVDVWLNVMLGEPQAQQ